MKHIDKMLKNRGPNSSRIAYRDGIFYHGTVLWQQGSAYCAQPVMSTDVIMLFNGDLYMKCLSDNKTSDTEYLFERLNSVDSEGGLLSIFKTITGPFSIICHFKSKLYFARDQLGRNSLIIGRHKESIFLCSVVDPAGEEIEAFELPPLGIYSIDTSLQECNLFPYQNLDNHEHNINQLDMLRKIIPVNVQHQINPEWMMTSFNIPQYTFEDIGKNQLVDSNFFDNLLNNPAIHKTCDIFLKLLSKSVEERVLKTQKLCKNCILSEKATCNHSHIGILFSGGVDCSMLSVLANNSIDLDKPIDLMNVSFEKVTYDKIKTDNINWNVPDRLTGLETVEELRRLCPDRQWNFIEINVTRAELGEHLKKLSSLIFPLSTVLDESIGAALYFASRGRGTIDGVKYESPNRVILIGSGADELFGGYSRHRNAFRRSTPDRDILLEELNLDWARLPTRNLARDDRVIGDNGVTVRAPFIEENFVSFVQKLKPLQRCFPALPEGIGDKLLLRICAYKLGLKNCSKFRKRALQFGSRIADKRQSAKDNSPMLAKGLNIMKIE